MVALVTGASRGIGKAIALELASLGYDLALVGRDDSSLAETEALAGNVRVCRIVADLSQAASADLIVQKTVETLGGLDLLVNCAGVPQKGPFTEVTPDEWDRVFAINARAPFFICKAALEPLKKSSKPIVINISSVVGFKGYIHQSVYSSSKHALAGFTKVFAKEVQPFGIRVHMISPGGVATEMVRKMRPDIDPSELIQPEEIAEIVRFLVTRKGTGTIDQFYIRRYSGLAFD
ncbi:MAG: SDR family oxidoreductase [Bacteroidales bacterium]|nr:SDR family oxidoreductase [Bacteroidales bacterium]